MKRSIWIVFATVALAGPLGLVAAAPRSVESRFLPQAELPHHLIAEVPLPPGPAGARVNTVTHKVYVAHPTTFNKVSVVDTLTHAHLATIPLPFGPSPWMAVSEKWNRLYVSDATNITRSTLVVDGATDKPVVTLPDVSTWGTWPSLAVHDGRDRLYLAQSWDENGVAQPVAVLSMLLDRPVVVARAELPHRSGAGNASLVAQARKGRPAWLRQPPWTTTSPPCRNTGAPTWLHCGRRSRMPPQMQLN